LGARWGRDDPANCPSCPREPEALAYLKARGLTHPELIDRFQLGYANRTLGLRLPQTTRKEGAEIRARLERLGLYRQSGHDSTKTSLTSGVTP
jgi:DNA primase